MFIAYHRKGDIYLHSVLVMSQKRGQRKDIYKALRNMALKRIFSISGLD